MPASHIPLVAVLGASGFVGSAVAARLASRPIRLRLVARRPSTVPAGQAHVEVRTADLTEPGAVQDAVAGADAVVHLPLHTAGGTYRAAETDPAGERVNLGTARDLVAALRRRPPGQGPPPVVVFPGSTSQVGPPRTPLLDGTEADRPATEYDRQKCAVEEDLRAATAAGVLRGVTLRLPTVFGAPAAPEAVDRGVVTAMVRRALAGQPLTLWGDGRVRRDLLHVTDVAAAIALSLDRADALAGGRWLLGSGTGVSLRTLFELVAEVVAEHTGRPPVPVTSVPVPAQATEMDGRDLVADPAAFRAATGWTAAVPPRAGIAGIVSAQLAATPGGSG
ncbi:NAD-dependent epimerase/dehydratase [Actinoalloteichus sp. AHMU CJ021]|uniref:NAD-dependent epimerase/dehydratase family protein n=1 Tax=Actinoalloteichus sp. AHMU CJ021 TaxID=2072503 RepID=UPI000CA08FFD|nr:NAD-dependent epimerase/dehydratase [Actinoalloteichus sp. AHMU CJ021]